MLFLKLLRFLLGYVRFRASGDFPERFLNLCAGNNIGVWNISRRSGAIEACAFAKDYKKMRKIRGQTRVRLRILTRHGFPFFKNRYRKRMGFALGFVMFFLILNVMSKFIWTVNIVGAEEVPREKITAALAEIGVAQGSRISGIDAVNARQQLLLEVPELSWAAINIEGTKATIDVKEVRKIPESKASDTPCNLKAVRDGRIVSSQITEGTRMFQVGDAVVAGDLLVSGIIQHANGLTSLKHAAGSVIAETNREICYTAKYEQTEIRRTGEVSTRSVLRFFGVDIPLYLGSVHGEYEKATEEWNMKVMGESLPISVITADFYKTEEVVAILNVDSALILAREQIKELEKEQLKGAEIISSAETVEQTEAGVQVTVKYVCRENIALEEILLINTTN